MSRVDEAMRRAWPSGAPSQPLRREESAPSNRRQAGVATLDDFGAEQPPADPSPPRPPLPPLPVPEPTRPDAVAPIDDLNATPLARNPRLVISPEATAACTAQYRRLAANLHDLQIESGLKVVMVSSTVSGGGKTLTIANLALTLSEAYRRRTLLIDADLRLPAVHEIFGVPKSPGLADVLEAGRGPVPIVRVSPWLNVLPAGHQASTPLAQLTSDHMRAIIHDATAQFDWILLDTPPISLLPDAQHLASVTQGVLLVIAAGITPYKLVQRAISSIGADRILGVALNYVEDGVLHNAYSHDRYHAAELTAHARTPGRWG
jgi:capsular exopolysaccharide synthesis family protein